MAHDDRDNPYGSNDRGYGQRGPGGFGGYAQGGPSRSSYDERRYRGHGEDRGFLERAADEVRSWFGDEEADRRRHMDARSDPHSHHYHSPEQTGSGFGARGERYEFDDNYRAWRDRQMAELDRDYQEFRQHRQGQFDREFEDWRTNRATQAGAAGTGMQYATKIREHQEVLGSDGEHIGTVDKVEGDQIKLTKREDGRHHFIPLSAVISVDNAVRLYWPAHQARQNWRTEAGESGMR